MKNSNDILNFIRKKSIYELKRKFDLIQSIFIGLIIAFILLLLELMKMIFEYVVSHSSSYIEKMPGFSIAGQILTLGLLGILVCIIIIKFYPNSILYLSLKERGIDRRNKKYAIRIIEKELEEI